METKAVTHIKSYLHYFNELAVVIQQERVSFLLKF
jgi:hypothetical protein